MGSVPHVKIPNARSHPTGMGAVAHTAIGGRRQCGNGFEAMKWAIPMAP